jgi:hypothetical protein
MPQVDYAWVKDQLKSATVRQGPGDATLALLKAWEQIDLPDDLAEDAIEIFASLALNKSLIKTPASETWVPAQPGGNTRVGDIVRVKHNAFKGEAGRIHNGRKGRVTAIRSGDIIFRSTDGLEPFLDNVHYPFNHLERRVR